jgi:hypothetical protein
MDYQWHCQWLIFILLVLAVVQLLGLIPAVLYGWNPRAQGRILDQRVMDWAVAGLQ